MCRVGFRQQGGFFFVFSLILSFVLCLQKRKSRLRQHVSFVCQSCIFNAVVVAVVILVVLWEGGVCVCGCGCAFPLLPHHYFQAT